VLTLYRLVRNSCAAANINACLRSQIVIIIKLKVKKEIMAKIATIFGGSHSPRARKVKKEHKKLNEWVWQRQDCAYYIFMPLAETERMMQCCHITKTEHKGKHITIFGRNLLHDMNSCTTTYANWRKDIEIPEESDVSVTTFVDKLSVAVSISKISV